MLLTCFLIASALGTAAAVWGAGWWQSVAVIWIAPLLFAGCFVALLLLDVLFLFVLSLFIDPKKDPPRRGWKFFYRVLVLHCQLVVRLARVRLHVTGEEKIPADRTFLAVSNHLSMFDPLVCLAHFPQVVSYVSKPENLSIPLAGKFMHACRFLAIDRENPRNAIRTIQKAANLVAGGEMSCCVYPEGTRSKTGELLPFHNGTLKIAQKSHAPVVILAVHHTEQVTHRFPLRHTDVYIDVAAVLSYESFAGQSSAELAQTVRAIMEDALNRLP